MESTQQLVKVNKPRCPFCHSDFFVEEEKTGCPRCMAWFHSECWAEHGGCTSCKTVAVKVTREETSQQAPVILEAPFVRSHGAPLSTEELGPEHQAEAKVEGRKGALIGVFTLLPFTPALFSLMNLQPPGLNRFLLLSGVMIFLVIFYRTLFDYFKRSSLQSALKKERRHFSLERLPRNS